MNVLYILKPNKIIAGQLLQKTALHVFLIFQLYYLLNIFIEPIFLKTKFVIAIDAIPKRIPTTAPASTSVKK